MSSTEKNKPRIILNEQPLFKIESGIPLPEKKSTSVLEDKTFPFTILPISRGAPNDKHFFVPYSSGLTKVLQSRIVVFHQRTNYRFRARPMSKKGEDGIGVWRLQDKGSPPPKPRGRRKKTK